MHEVVSGERDKIMKIVRERANAGREARSASQMLDVRLKRVDLPQEVSESVYRRMEAERKRVANELRSQGSAEAEKIRAEADKQREVIIAEAYREAQRIKGEGDAKASAIYAQAFGENPEFYAFYRSLEAYRSSFKNRATCWCSTRIRSSSSTSESPGGSRPAGKLTTTLLMAFALMLVIEGVLPFLAPGAWRETFRRILEFSDGQIRFFGLTSMLVGLALIALARA